MGSIAASVIRIFSYSLCYYHDRQNALRLEEKERIEKELLNQILDEADEYKINFHSKRKITCDSNIASGSEKVSMKFTLFNFVINSMILQYFNAILTGFIHLCKSIIIHILLVGFCLCIISTYIYLLRFWVPCSSAFHVDYPSTFPNVISLQRVKKTWVVFHEVAYKLDVAW